MMTVPGTPPVKVLEAFGAHGVPVRLSGGQGHNFRAGGMVLKPAVDNPETRWISEFYLSASASGFKFPTPVRSFAGGFVYGGWQAWRYIPGEHIEGEWQKKIDLCIQFHDSMSDVPYPAYFPFRERNPWVVADHAAWGEIELEHHQHIAPCITSIQEALRPVHCRSQLIHGDFGGNILFASGCVPAVIDFSPYWRPVPFAVGVMVADAIVWEGADFSLISAGESFPDFHQHLLRAELRRVIELEMLDRMYGMDVTDQIRAHLPLIQHITGKSFQHRTFGMAAHSS